jgi:hypothetical protein
MRSYQDLLDHLATLTRATVTFAGQRVEKISNPTAVQRRAFELIGSRESHPARLGRLSSRRS